MKTHSIAALRLKTAASQSPNKSNFYSKRGDSSSPPHGLQTPNIPPASKPPPFPSTFRLFWVGLSQATRSCTRCSIGSFIMSKSHQEESGARLAPRALSTRSPAAPRSAGGPPIWPPGSVLLSPSAPGERFRSWGRLAARWLRGKPGWRSAARDPARC